jgi:hypothetical protein
VYNDTGTPKKSKFDVSPPVAQKSLFVGDTFLRDTTFIDEWLLTYYTRKSEFMIIEFASQ